MAETDFFQLIQNNAAFRQAFAEKLQQRAPLLGDVENVLAALFPIRDYIEIKGITSPETQHINYIVTGLSGVIMDEVSFDDLRPDSKSAMHDVLNKMGHHLRNIAYKCSDLPVQSRLGNVRTILGTYLDELGAEFGQEHLVSDMGFDTPLKARSSL